MTFNAEYPPSPPRSENADEHEKDSSLNSKIPFPPFSSSPTKVLDIDAKTPDFHVARDPRLIRLTGVHPFNVEAPLSALFDQGFLTSPELFYVRNHGAVPQVKEEEIPDWELSIEGLVENPITLNFSQILSDFEQVTLPITLVCAGNRRKEQNMLRKSQGFSWGAAGVSTSLFTGPMLGEILKAARPLGVARYLCMEGADQLPNGHYGTSVRLKWAMDPERGMMLAHKMNGEALRPDHGRPLRAVIPGMIGGRSVKWLKRLIVTDKPSDNWYHIYDNRVLPTMVTPEMAKRDKSWWTDERYAIYDLSVNSAIAYPAHEEKIVINGAPEYYNVRGYAYTGGMRRISRAELSLDKGATWRLANINYPEDSFRDVSSHLFGGKLDMAGKEASYCWCFWNIEVPMNDLATSEDIVLRAMDESMNTQPRDTYWSVLGMMHNAWFRVAIRRDEGGILTFEHPTQPALLSGGWMERVKKEGGDLEDGNWGEQRAGTERPRVMQEEKEAIKMKNDNVAQVIDLEEFSKHSTAESTWFVVDGEVYDGTKFLNEHPGGAQSIISAAGQDATDEFMGIHSESAKAMMPEYHIGSLSQADRIALNNATEDAPETGGPTFLNPRAWKNSTLIAKESVSRDTRIFTFKLDSDEQSLGLPVGQHLMLRINDSVTDEVIVRPYTPISQDLPNGIVHLLVKIYFTTQTTRGGKMTTAMDLLSLGQMVSFKGPIGKFEYMGNGHATISGHEKYIKNFRMICAGSGITPIFQVLRAVLEDTEDPTRCVVLDGNRTEEDILCREELDRYAKDYAGKVKIIHTLSKPGEAWGGRKGRIDAELVGECTPGDRDGAMWLICGPEVMQNNVLRILTENGWTEDDMVFF